MFLFRKVAIIGVGFIGGSLALAMKKNRICREVVGVSKHKRTIILALSRKAIDKGSLSLDIIRGSDLVILSTPVSSIMHLKNEVLRYVDRECIITDVGSTKESVFLALSKVFPNYIGSHPLAGSEKKGIANASSGIFKGSLCLLTLAKGRSTVAFNKVKEMWRRIGARVVTLSPKEHDKKLGFASHLPHAVAYALINSIPNNALKFAAGGLKDTTRISASDPGMWNDIFMTNRDNLLDAICSFEDSLKRIKSAIKSNDKRILIKILSQSKKKRESLK